jgi:hypothetical protein
MCRSGICDGGKVSINIEKKANLPAGYFLEMRTLEDACMRTFTH